MKQLNEDLPLTTSHWGTYRVEIKGGKVKSLHPFEQDDDASPIGQGIVEVLDDSSRIKTPMVRSGWLDSNNSSFSGRGRGDDSYISLSWDEAIKLVGDELTRVKETYGNEAIFGGSYGWASAGRFHHAQSQLHRFLNCIGGYTASINTYSFAAAEVAMPHVLGSFRKYLASATSWQSISDHTELFVAFGGVPLKNGQINSGGLGTHIQRDSLRKAKKNRTSFVNISPIASDIPSEIEAQWLPIRPCTDTALLLGLAHTLVAENLEDRIFLAKYTVGFEKFEAYLRGTKDGVIKDAEWASAITEISSQNIRDLARKMATSRTMISVSWSLTRQDNGEQPFWAAVSLAAMIGQIGLPGGGIGFGYTAVNSIGQDKTSLAPASFPQGKNPISSFIPVARIADMLLHPGSPYEYDGKKYNYPDIRLVYWAGGNPFHHHQDLKRLSEAWQRPETVIVNEWCWNALAKRADIILPCTTPLERNDFAMSSGDSFLFAMRKCIEPLGAAKNDFDIFSAIAKTLGIEHRFTEGRSENDWIEWIYSKTAEKAKERGNPLPEYETFKQKGWFKLDTPVRPTIMMEDFRQDPEKNPLGTPSGKIEIFSETVSAFGYEECPGHPFWREPAEWLGSSDGADYYHLISNQPTRKLHSQLDHGSYNKKLKIEGREPVHINPLDAQVGNIEEGDVVRLFNDRGACYAAAVLDEKLRQGVLQLSTGAWYDPIMEGDGAGNCKHGNPNVLTRDSGTSRLAQGPVAHACLVKLEVVSQLERKLPTPYVPPTIKDCLKK